MPLGEEKRRLQYRQRRMLRVPKTLDEIDALIALASTREMQESSRNHVPGPTRAQPIRLAEYHVAKLFYKRFRKLFAERPGEFSFEPRTLTRGNIYPCYPLIFTHLALVLSDAGVRVGRSFRFECNRLIGRTEWLNPSERRAPNPAMWADGGWANGGYGGWEPAPMPAESAPAPDTEAAAADDDGSTSSGGWGSGTGWDGVGAWGTEFFDPTLTYSRPVLPQQRVVAPLAAWAWAQPDGWSEDHGSTQGETDEDSLSS
ncbi:hypothetical protein B0H13DRAFT_1920316 [Mycena leptocephala]|nr:hypothetical protein B0H13DRAFT_1920316 [Mycena leptocephala]